MNEIGFDLFAASALWLGAGVSVTLAAGRQFFLDFILRSYVRRHRRLPPRIVFYMAFAIAVLFWPKTFAVLAGMSRR
jgi:hypothetical protein